ncbi:IclR family transcriptional regulator [Roseomonas sp. BN140053]|uniref:IclR family transcriptional regulator n=1 Tax=Roseomonas sp. BN140053 TaxID=3391898 RepID=UPI0039E9EF72
MDGSVGAPRRGIQSVETGLRVLAALAGCGGAVTLSTLAGRAGLSASQTHRYLSSLMAAGMAKQEPGTGLYDLDAGAIRLGLAALARLDVFARADTAFAGFAQNTGRTCLLAVWGDAGATVVRWFPGNPPVITSLAIGSVLPLLRSATGRVFLAFGDRAATDAQAEREARRDRASLPASAQALRDAVWAAGSATIDSTLIPGLRAVAAPVFDLQGRLSLVATALATPAFDPSGDPAATAALHAACAEVTAAIGGLDPRRPEASARQASAEADRPPRRRAGARRSSPRS